MNIRTTCTKCNTAILLDFGELTKDEALAFAARLDTQPRECPGRHTEFGGWRNLYQLDDAIHRAYDLGESDTTAPLPTDTEFVESFLEGGHTVVDGGLNTVPELGLTSIHDYTGLEHLGFGSFANQQYLFNRIDSPRSTRFYLRIER